MTAATTARTLALAFLARTSPLLGQERARATLFRVVATHVPAPVGGHVLWRALR